MSAVTVEAALEQGFSNVRSLITKMNHNTAAALREAIEDFNQEPISHSTIDALRSRVLLIADVLAEDHLVFQTDVPSVPVLSLASTTLVERD